MTSGEDPPDREVDSEDRKHNAEDRSWDVVRLIDHCNHEGPDGIGFPQDAEGNEPSIGSAKHGQTSVGHTSPYDALARIEDVLVVAFHPVPWLLSPLVELQVLLRSSVTWTIRVSRVSQKS